VPLKEEKTPAASHAQTDKKEPLLRQIAKTLENFSTNVPFETEIAEADLDFKGTLEGGETLTLKTALENFSAPANGLPQNFGLNAQANFGGGKAADIKPLVLKATLKTPTNAKESSFNALLNYGGKDLAAISADFEKNFIKASGKFKISASKADIENFAKDLPLPLFSAEVYADFAYDFEGDFAKAAGSFKADADNLKALDPKLAPLKKIDASGEFNVSKMGGVLSISAFSLDILEDKRPVVYAKTLKNLDLSLDDIAGIPAGKLAELSINLSADKIKAFAGDAAQFSSNDIRFTLVFEKPENADFIRVSTSQPALISNLSVGPSETPATYGMTLKITADAEIKAADSFGAVLQTDIPDGKEVFAIKAEIDARSGIANASLKVQAQGPLAPIFKAIPRAEAFAKDGLSANVSASAKSAGGKLASWEAQAHIKNPQNAEVLTLTAKDLKGNLKAQNLPLALAKPFAPQLGGGLLTADVNFDLNNGKYIAAGKLAANGVFIENGGEIILAGLNPGAEFSAAFDGKTAKLDLPKLEFAAQGGRILGISALANYDVEHKALKSASAKFTAALPALLSQKCLQKFNNVLRGTVEGEASYADNSAKVSAVFSGLTARSVSGVIDRAQINADAAFKDGFAFSKADASFRINSTLGETSGTAQFELLQASKIKLDVKSAVVEDLQLFAKLFSNPLIQTQSATQPSGAKIAGKDIPSSRKVLEPGYDTKKTAAQAAAKDEKAFWDAGFEADAALSAQKIIQNGKPIVENAAASAKLRANSIDLESLSAKVAGADLKAVAALVYVKENKLPYELKKSTLKISKLPVGEFSSSSSPMLEGNFDVDLALYGIGANAQNLANRLCGSAVAKSETGTVRLIDKNTVTGQVTNVAGTILQIGGSLLGNRVKEMSGTGDLIGLLSEFKYKGIELSIERLPANYNINIKKGRIAANDFIMDVSGGITYDAALPIDEQPLNVPITMYVPDNNIKILLTTLNFGLQAAPGLTGYYVGPQFLIYGSIKNPQNNVTDIITNPRKALKNAGAAAEGVVEGAGTVVEDAGSTVENAARNLLNRL